MSICDDSGMIGSDLITAVLALVSRIESRIGRRFGFGNSYCSTSGFGCGTTKVSGTAWLE